MNPLTYISNISRNNISNSDIINNKEFNSPEIIALGVFIFFYLIIRIIEKFIIPIIPSFMTTELTSLFRWSPILVPIIFGFTYYSGNKKETNDKVLKKRMIFWQSKKKTL